MEWIAAESFLHPSPFKNHNGAQSLHPQSFATVSKTKSTEFRTSERGCHVIRLWKKPTPQNYQERKTRGARA